MNGSNSNDVATCAVCSGQIFRTNMDGKWHHPGSGVDHKAEPAEDKPNTAPMVVGTGWLSPMQSASSPQSDEKRRVAELYRQAQAVDPWPGTEVARFSDVAMYEAEPVTRENGPEVFVLAMNPDPLGSAAAAMAMYRGQVVRDLSEVTDDQRREVLKAMAQTKLQAPLEFIKCHFLIEGVSRSFTHQMVRQRTAVYAQESLRFAVKDGPELRTGVKLPPSLAGLKDDDPRRVRYERAVDDIGAAYAALIGAGVPAEDARELLPGGTLTRLHYATDFRNLLEHAGNRLCTQAQFEWRMVFVRLAAAMREFGGSQMYLSPKESLDGTTTFSVRQSSAWQFDALADQFRPACYLTGKCEFAAMDLDRACKIRDRVDAFHEAGVPSSEWDRRVAVGENGIVEAIRPEEWLLDPSAARERR